jgi:nitrite reductase/ring-hydroxylating ferredoxin subunit
VSQTSGQDTGRPGRWRVEFPYHWDADEVISRRRLLQFAVFTSGTLFACTAALAALASLTRRTSAHVQPIIRADALPEGQAHYFAYPDPDSQAMLLHLPGGRFVAYSQRCTHLSCAVYYQPQRDRLYCPCHEGVFSPATGDPVAGPPQRRLEQIRLRRDGDMLLAEAIEP